MRVFISWSGEKSRMVASGLKEFLRGIDPSIQAWHSDLDVEAGERWADAIARRLESSDVGIICVTRESIESPWVLFEAGALSRAVVCPYLIDVARTQLDGPLSQFQSKEATRDQTLELLRSLNFTRAQGALTDEALERGFEACWPGLEATIAEANRRHRPLPTELRTELVEEASRIVFETDQISLHVGRAGLPPSHVNWTRAPVYVWDDVVQLAVDEQRLGALLEALCLQYPHNERLRRLRADVVAWEQHGAGAISPSPR